MKTQLHQQKSEDLQANVSELVLKKKSHNITKPEKTTVSYHLLRAVWYKKDTGISHPV